MPRPTLSNRTYSPLASVAITALVFRIVAGCTLLSAADQPLTTRFSTDVSPLYQSVSQITPPAGADVLFIEDQEEYVFDEAGKAVHTQYFLYKILTQKGAEEWNTAGVRWDAWREDRPSLRARVITPDYSPHPLDASTVTDSPAKETQDSVFSDRRFLRAPLPAIAPGALVEEEIVSRETGSLPGAGIVERLYFGGSVPVQHTRFVLDAPAGLPLRYGLRLLPDLKPAKTEADGRVRLTFERGTTDPLDDADSGLPSDVSAFPSLLFSTGTSWHQVAEEYVKVVGQQLSGDDLRTLTSKLIAGKNSRDEKAAAILQYLGKEVRYTGVEFGESNVVPRTPSETLTRKYGDCKDKSLLLVAMLRAAKIPAYVALLNAGNREDVADDLPGMGLFDHAIVYVPGSPELWIDATDEYARLGQLPDADQDRFALVARAGTESLVRTPATSSVDNILIEKREIYLAENGPARIIETSQPHGASESFYRRNYADKENKRVLEQLESYVKGQYLAEKLDRMDRSAPDDFSKQFELVLESDKARRGATDLTVAAAAIRFEGLFSRLPGEFQERQKEEEVKPGKKPKGKRTSDYQLREAFVTEWQYKIVPPAGFQPKALPRNSRLTLGPAILTQEFAPEKDNSVHATIRFDTVKRRLTAAEVDEMREKIVQLREGEPILIYFEPVAETLLAQGKMHEALQSYRDLVALHPKEAVHHLQVAATLLAGGMGEGARAEARKAVSLEPGSALAQKTLAEILEFDLVGRKFRPGSDYSGAEAAYREAVRLDPDDKATALNLAILLEYNRWGLRYGPGARLKESIEEYRKLPAAKLAELGAQNNLPYVLFYHGEFAEAQKMAQALNPQPLALVVACEAAQHGSQAALDLDRKQTPGEEQFHKTAEAAGEMLVNLRKYLLAADLEEAGAVGEKASETAAYAALYRKTRPFEEIPVGDDPGGVAFRFRILTSDPDLTLAQLKSVCSRNGAQVLATQENLEAFIKDAKRDISRKARTGEWNEVGIDLSLARAQPRIQGNDVTGYKVTLWPSADYKKSRYIVKEDDHYKLLATSEAPTALGLEVLDRIAANDLAGARVLLDWLREDEHLPGGDDPLAGDPFPHVWARGKEADPGAMKIAAAALLVENETTAARGVAVLEEGEKSAPTERDKLNVTLALLDGYGSLKQYEKALSQASALAHEYPESKRLFYRQAYYLRGLGRFDDADKLATERLKRIPDDVDVTHVLTRGAELRDDYRKAHDLYQKIAEEGTANHFDLNAVAWFSLFIPRVEPSDLEYALKAAQLSDNNSSILHTLGCVYAELGKTKEAREVLLQAMDKLSLDEPDDDYWYAFGRIAEQYGEWNLATADYNRVTKPKEPLSVASSSYQLAQNRLAVASSRAH